MIGGLAAILLWGALGPEGRAPVPSDRTVTIVADTYCPYNCAPGSERPGISIEIARRIFEPAGWTVRYEAATWTEALSRVRGGEADAVTGAYPSDAPDFVFADSPYAKSTNCFFTRGGTWKYAGTASLRSIRLGVIKDYSYGNVIDRWVEANGPGGHVLVAEGDDALDHLFDALDRGEIEALVEDDAVVVHRLRQRGRPGTLRDAGCEAAAGIYVAFSPAPARAERTRTLVALWNARFAILRRGGEISAISRRYE